MSNLTITNARAVKVIEQHTWPNGESLTRGKYGRLNPTSGQAELGKATTAAEVGFGGIVTGDDGANTLTLVRKGLVDVGDALAAMSFGDVVYLSDTDGILDTASGTVTVQIGHVVPGWGATTPDKLLAVDVMDADL